MSVLNETLVEQVVEMPIVNPESGGTSRSFVYMGKVDVVTSDTVVDYKNTSHVERFIHTLSIAFQPELYALAVRHQFKRVLTSMEYRLVQRPQKRFTPKDAVPNFAVMREGQKSAVAANLETREDAEAVIKRKQDAIPYKHRITGGKWEQSYFVEDRTKPAVTRDDYEQACYQQLIDEPERVCEHSLHLNGGRMRQAEGHLWDCSKRILDNRRTGRWLTNAHACYDWNKECPFLSTCECVAAGADPQYIIEEGYHVVENAHPELGDKGKGRLNILTHSSCSTFAQCQMKYYWLYERQLRKGQEDSEPLWVGNAIHKGMEVFAKDGIEAALVAIDEWAEQNPVLGDDVRKQDEQIAKSRAMVRAASERWPR